MNNMIVKTLNNSYAALVVIKTSDSPFDVLDIISNNLQEKQVSGLILIDELLHSGNGEERFVEAVFEQNAFEKASFRFADIPKNNELRAVVCEWLREDPERLEYSGLSTAQQKLILNGFNI